MKLKKILAAVAAAAVAVSAMAVNVFAAEVDGPSKEFTVSVNDDADKGKLVIAGSEIPAGTTEVKFVISFSGDGAYGGGAIGRNVGGAWKQDDTNFSNDNADSLNITINAAEIDKDPDTNESTGIEVQCWWVGGGSMTVKSTFVTDDSAAPAAEEAAPAASEDEAAEDDAAPAEDETADAEDEDVDTDEDVDVDTDEDDAAEAEPAAEETASVEEAPAPVVENATAAPATGNTAAASIVTVMAVAGVAAIAAKKRK